MLPTITYYPRRKRNRAYWVRPAIALIILAALLFLMWPIISGAVSSMVSVVAQVFTERLKALIYILDYWLA
jgi:phosphotransferase system  glucose/maltose/N-acetylglucosamine-specific IIC component